MSDPVEIGGRCPKCFPSKRRQRRPVTGRRWINVCEYRGGPLPRHEDVFTSQQTADDAIRIVRKFKARRVLYRINVVLHGRPE